MGGGTKFRGLSMIGQQGRCGDLDTQKERRIKQQPEMGGGESRGDRRKVYKKNNAPKRHQKKLSRGTSSRKGLTGENLDKIWDLETNRLKGSEKRRPENWENLFWN